MFTQLSQRIEALTLQIEILVDQKEIEQCLALLVERHTLLIELKATFDATKNNPELSKAFTSLLKWVQQEDAIYSAKVLDYRKQSKQESIDQVKTKKALRHYKNVT